MIKRQHTTTQHTTSQNNATHHKMTQSNKKITHIFTHLHKTT